MNRPSCPKCHKPGVQQRNSARTGRDFLANVETYPSGVSYFRSLHTFEECDQYAADFAARVAENVAREERRETVRQEGLRAQVLIPRYKAIYGADALRDNWSAVEARWLPAFTGVGA